MLWLAHAWESWARPASVGRFGWLLLAGLPVVLAGAVVAFALVGPDPEPGQYEVLAPGQVHDGRRRLLVLGAEVLAAWLAVLALEPALAAVRSSRLRSSRLRPKDRHL